MFKCVGILVLVSLCNGVACFATLTPEIDRDANGVPGAAIQGKTPSGTWKDISVDANGNIITTSGSGTAGSTMTVVGPLPVYSGQTVFISTGTSGKITGVTTYTIAATDRVSSYSFLFDNSSDATVYGNIVPSYTNASIPLKNGQGVSSSIVYPVATAFNITLPVTSSMTYVIDMVK